MHSGTHCCTSITIFWFLEAIVKSCVLGKSQQTWFCKTNKFSYIKSPILQKIKRWQYLCKGLANYLSDKRFMIYSMSDNPSFGAVSNKMPFSSEASGWERRLATVLLCLRFWSSTFLCLATCQKQNKLYRESHIKIDESDELIKWTES